MVRYIVKRILSIIPLLLALSLVVFLFSSSLKGSGAYSLLGDEASAEEVSILEKQMGLEGNILERYIRYLGKVITFDFGRSTFGGERVSTLILNHLPVSIALALFSIFFMTVITLSSVYIVLRHKSFNQGFSILSLLSLSLPPFVFALLLILLFSVLLPIFPVAGYVSFFDNPILSLRTLFLPALTLGFMHSGLVMRYLRQSATEELFKDYAKLALAKGQSKRGVLLIHIWRNMQGETLTLFSQSFLVFLFSSAAIEYLFAIPGLGNLAVTSIARRDVITMQALVLLSAFTNVVVSLIVDLLYVYLDRRVLLYE